MPDSWASIQRAGVPGSLSLDEVFALEAAPDARSCEVGKCSHQPLYRVHLRRTCCACHVTPAVLVCLPHKERIEACRALVCMYCLDRNVVVERIERL